MGASGLANAFPGGLGRDGQGLRGIVEGPSVRKRTLRIWHRIPNCPCCNLTKRPRSTHKRTEHERIAAERRSRRAARKGVTTRAVRRCPESVNMRATIRICRFISPIRGRIMRLGDSARKGCPEYESRPKYYKASFRTERWGLSATARFWTGLPSR